jgi:hypothetical protein
LIGSFQYNHAEDTVLCIIEKELHAEKAPHLPDIASDARDLRDSLSIRVEKFTQ